MVKDSTEFNKPTVRKLAERAGQVCSNPECKRPTSGGHSVKDKSVIVGDAAHIFGQRPGSKRYDPSKKPSELRSIDNGIWLCKVCHKLIDTDEVKFSADVLIGWKNSHESTVLQGDKSNIKKMEQTIKDIKKILEAHGIKSSVPVSAPNVLEDENIKKSVKAWGKGEIDEAYKHSKNAYFSSSGHIKLQAIINMILLVSDESVTNSSYYVSLSNEGINLANHLKDISSSAVIKAHKAYFLQHKIFQASLKLYGEAMTRQITGFPTMSDSEFSLLSSQINSGAEEIDKLVYESQKEAYAIKDWSALAHIRITIANTIGLTYFLTKQLGGDTGTTEQQTIMYFLDAKNIYKQLGDNEGVANALHNLANNLRFFGDKERARKYASEALTIAKKIKYVELIRKSSELLDMLR